VKQHQLPKFCCTSADLIKMDFFYALLQFLSSSYINNTYFFWISWLSQIKVTETDIAPHFGSIRGHSSPKRDMKHTVVYANLFAMFMLCYLKSMPNGKW